MSNYTQIYGILNDAVSDVLGNQAPRVKDTTSFVDLGRAMADANMYDALYGVPGVDGKRPFFTTDNVVMPENKGLIGILTSIGAEAKGDPTQDTYGRSMNSGMYYYFISKWKSADEDPQSFIENIPYVVGASENNGGSSAYSQLYINFDATSTTEGELPSYVTKWS